MKLEDVKVGGTYVSRQTSSRGTVTTVVEVDRVEGDKVWCVNARAGYGLEWFLNNFEPGDNDE